MTFRGITIFKTSPCQAQDLVILFKVRYLYLKNITVSKVGTDLRIALLIYHAEILLKKD